MNNPVVLKEEEMSSTSDEVCNCIYAMIYSLSKAAEDAFVRLTDTIHAAIHLEHS